MKTKVARVVSVDDGVRLLPEDQESLRQVAMLEVYGDRPTPEEAAKRIKDASIAIFDWVPMTAVIIAQAKNLRLICVAGTGCQGRVDLGECQRRNITVCNAPDYATEAVAEHAVGLMLNAAHRISTADRGIRQEKWQLNAYKGIELWGKTLGIVGHGKIGRRVAGIAKEGLDMNVISVNSKSSRREFETLLKQSDVISLHVPVNEKTRGMLGKKEFRLMKPGVIIVNTARGTNIEMEALIENLRSGKVFATGLDVFPEEPLPAADQLTSFPNVILTPHIASLTSEAETKISRTIKDNIINFIKGNPINVVQI